MSEAKQELASIAASLRAYLEWQEDTGALGIPRRAKAPVNEPAPAPVTVNVSDSAPAPSPAPSPVSTTMERSAPVPAPAAPAPAPPAAPARALPLIHEEVRACAKCGLAPTRTNTVFSRGNPEAKLVFVGEAPGADEDAQGLPFVGRAGQLLDKMIQAMGLDPVKDVYVCNIIKCRPPGNRRPEPEEIAACIPYLHEQLDAIQPRVIVAMGNTAVGALLETKIGITKVRGNWKLYRGRVPVMPTYHPSYLIRPSAQQQEAKRQAWEDLQAVMKELGLPPRKP